MGLVRTEVSNREEFGFFTRAMASWCHDCRMCSYSTTNPDTGFGKLMEWHRGWCPAWAARIKIYGDEHLQLDPMDGNGRKDER